MSYLHYKNYHKQRLEQMPIRNLPTRISYPLLNTVLEIDWNTSEEDGELNEFRYRVASAEARLKAAELQRDAYHKVVKWPVHVSSVSKTDARVGYSNREYCKFEKTQRGVSWSQRLSVIESEWERIKHEKDHCWDHYGDWSPNKARQLAQEELEYMTEGAGRTSYLRERAEAIRLDFISEFFDGHSTITTVLETRERSLKSCSKNLRNATKSLSACPSYDGYDPTSDIDAIRKLNKARKDAIVDRDLFFEAFGCDYSDNALACSFTTAVDDIKESNPYLEKRLLWEARVQEIRDIFNRYENEVQSLKKELEDLGSEEDFKKIQDQRDIKFRQRTERKKALKESIEDRAESVVDAAEEAAAQLKMNQIKQTRTGHGQVSSTGEPKHAHLTVEEALDAQTSQWQTKKRALEIYKVAVKIPYTKWNPDSRRREQWSLTRDFWFLRKLRA